jgi:flagellar biogenesis protein FliO
MSHRKWEFILLTLLSASFFMSPTVCAESQEGAPAVPPEQGSSPSLARPAPPEASLQQPAAPIPPLESNAPEIPPEVAKIRQVQQVMDKPQPGTEAAAAQPPDEISIYYSGIRAFSALLVVLALILLLTYWVRRRGRRLPLFSGASLAGVMGRVYLEPRVCLHFVQTGGKVLVIGVTPSSISLLSAFDAESFASALKKAPETASAEASGFVAHLEASMREAKKRPAEPLAEDEEVAALRKDIERLQRYLDDGTRFPKEA